MLFQLSLLQLIQNTPQDAGFGSHVHQERLRRQIHARTRLEHGRRGEQAGTRKEKLQTEIEAREEEEDKTVPEYIFNVELNSAALRGSRQGAQSRELRIQGALPFQHPFNMRTSKEREVEPLRPHHNYTLIPEALRGNPSSHSIPPSSPSQPYPPKILCLFSAALRLKMLVCCPASGR